MNNSSLVSEVRPNPVNYSATAVTRVIVLLFMIMVTNFNFTIYHLYMRQKPEFSNRLLNVLYSFHASLLQFGSVLILSIFCVMYIDAAYENFIQPAAEVLITIRMLHLSCVFINIFCIGMATVIQSFKMDLYLFISVRITGKIVRTTTFLISILFNIFVKFLIKENENDKEHENYQNFIKSACALLNMIALAMCLLVLLRNIIFCLKKHFFTILGNVHNFLLRKRASVTPIVTIEMESSKIEVVNINVSEPNNTIFNNNFINQNLDIEEYIRLVVLKEFYISIILNYKRLCPCVCL